MQHFLRLRVECDLVEVTPGQVIVGNVTSNVHDLAKLGELLAILASEVELARVQQRSLSNSHGSFPVVKLA